MKGRDRPRPVHWKESLQGSQGLAHNHGSIRGALIVLAIFLLYVAATVNAGDRNQELIKASMAGDLQKAQRLLDEGANVNARFKDGFTALMLASMANRPAIVKLLLQKGADANATTSHGATALMLSSGKGLVDIVALLLEAGADINAKEKSGWTAMTHATKNGHKKTRALLLKHGAKD